MNDKEKQIREIARVTCKLKCKYCENCYHLRQAEALYNAKCRILTEDSIVLTKEEYKQLLDNAIRVDMGYLDHELANARKETAEKIFNALIGYTMEEDGWTWCISAENIQELAKQYGVEIGEEV